MKSSYHFCSVTSHKQRRFRTTISSRTTRSSLVPLLLSLILCCGFTTRSIDFVDALVLPNIPKAIASVLTPDGRKREALKAEMFSLIKQSSPPGNSAGSFDDPSDGDRFFEIFNTELPALNPTPDPAQSPLFSGEWECIWTSEKEINLLVKAGLLGENWQRTYQKIDIPNKTLENFLEFDNEAALSVGSYIQPQEDKGNRFNIRFQEAVLRWKGFTLNLPPIGKGWGELLYLDEDIRLQRDIRGDFIVARRVRR